MIASNFKTNEEYQVYLENSKMFIVIPGSLKSFYVLIQMDLMPYEVPEDLSKGYFIIDGQIYNGYFTNVVSETISSKEKNEVQLTLF